MIFAYSINEEEGYEELGDFDSYEAALQAALVQSGCFEPGDHVWIGQKADARIDQFIPSRMAEDILERVSELAGEHFGEWAEDWPEYKPDDEKNLERTIRSVLVDWLRVTCPPRFWTVDCVKKFKVPEALNA